MISTSLFIVSFTFNCSLSVVASIVRVTAPVTPSTLVTTPSLSFNLINASVKLVRLLPPLLIHRYLAPVSVAP